MRTNKLVKIVHIPYRIEIEGGTLKERRKFLKSIVKELRNEGVILGGFEGIKPGSCLSYNAKGYKR